METLLLQLQTANGEWVDVGYLRHAQNRNWFEFLETYWRLPRRPVLGQIFEEEGKNRTPSSLVALPHWFSHLLPEGRLRQAVAEAAHASDQQEFELLKILGGTDLPGATRVLPFDSEHDVIIPEFLNVRPDAEQAEDPLLKFSLAGAQLKFSVYGDDRGLTVPAAGTAGNYIVKLPDERPGFSGVPEAELGSLTLARLSGIDTVDAHLVSVDDVVGLEVWAQRSRGMALAVRRFDRREHDRRVHMEELAQVMNIPARVERAKYRKANFETIAVLIAAHAGAEAVGEVIDRIVLNVLAGNGDAHLKNWALMYEDGRTPSIAPLYDVVPTVLYFPQDDLGLNLNKSKQFEEVSPDSFDRIGIRTGTGVAFARERAKTAAEQIMQNWPVLADYLSRENYNQLSVRRNKLRLL